MNFETGNFILYAFPESGDAVIPESLPAQRRYLCLVNPKSGPGRSLEIFLERVRPVFSEADISYLLLVTGAFTFAISAFP